MKQKCSCWFFVTTPLPSTSFYLLPVPERCVLHVLLGGPPLNLILTIPRCQARGSFGYIPFPRGSWCGKCWEDLAAMWLDQDWWAHGPAVEQSASELFRATSHSAGLAYDGLHVRFTCYPYRVAELVRGTEEEIEIEKVCFLSAPQCCLDPWSAHLRDLFPDIRALSTSLCRSMIFAAMSLWYGSTYSTERLHSQNARRILGRRQTSRPSLQQVSVWHAGVSSPDFLVDVVCPPDEQKRKAADQNPEPSHKRRRGGGGAWRTFCHVEGSKQGIVDFKDLSQRYAALDAECKAVYAELGRQATLLHRSGQTAFPATYRKANDAFASSCSSSLSSSCTGGSQFSGSWGVQSCGFSTDQSSGMLRSEAQASANPQAQETHAPKQNRFHSQTA